MNKRRQITDHRSQIGFTLIEAVVATAVFAFVVTSILGVYLAVLRIDSRTRGERAVAQNARFIMEYLAKGIRNGAIDYSNYPGGSTSGVTSDLWFVNQASEEEHIFLNGESVSLTKDINGVPVTTNLNSSGVKVSKLKFLAAPAGNPLTSAKNYNRQPNVTVILELTSNYGQRPGNIAKINLQTSLSTRQYPSRQ